MRYLILAAFLAGCGTITVGDRELTPEQRCVGYRATLMMLDRKVAEGESLSDAEQVAYDVATVGAATVCMPAT